jgi:hypothetical protein
MEALIYSIENAPTNVGVVNQADYYQPLTLPTDVDVANQAD